MEDSLSRLKAELNDLHARRVDLETFIWVGNSFDSLSEHQKNLLRLQLGVMTTYESILKMRLADLGEAR